MKQTRFISADASGLRIREGENGQTSRVVEGRAVVFGVRSVNLTPYNESRVVYEVLEPGCVSKELLQRSNIVYCLNHETKVPFVLGRYRNSAKDTLKVELREDGIYNSCDLPNTSNANDTLELMKRGDIYGQSFAFEDDWRDSENGVSYERTNETVDGREVWIRHVKRITALYDMSIVTSPAYEQTTVATREQSEAIDQAIEAQLKREQPNGGTQGETDEECEAREKAEREANGGETNAEKQAREAREAQEREANGGETNAEKQAREEREAKEKKEREAVAVMRMRRRLLALDRDSYEIDF